jgi:hypothetical protein
VSPLSPFPVNRSTDPLFTYDFATWLSDGNWVITGDAVLVDGWTGTDSAEFALQQLFFWDNDPDAEQDPSLRDTAATFVIPGLPPRTFVRLTVGFNWRLGNWDQEIVGIRVNGVLFEPAAGPSGTLLADTVPIQASGITNADGELTFAIVVENIHPSFNMNFGVDNLTINPVVAELADIYYDAGVGYIAGNPFSITRGGISFDPQEVIEDYDFPGKRAPVEGCDEVVSSRPVMRTRFLLTGESQFEVYRPDGAWSDGEIEGMRQYVLGAMGRALTTGYLDNFLAVWPRARGDYIGVLFEKALCRKYTMGSTDKDEGGQDVEIEGRIPAGDPLTTVPYQIFTLPAGATQVP